MELWARDKFSELSFYTWGHPDTIYFIHQYIVDAFQAQTADKNTKPITIIFSLIGLRLYLEKNYTGRQVQQAHIKLAQNKKGLPRLDLQEQCGTVTVSAVLRAEPGKERDLIIKEWCSEVWTAYEK